MRKLIIIFTAIVAMLVPATANAATTSTNIKDLKSEIFEQQALYDKYSEMSADYLEYVINNKLSFNETLEYNRKIKDCRVKFLDAAKKMQELRVELYELTNE